MEVEKEVLKGQVTFMGMVIGNNMGISNNYQNNTKKTGEYKNVREYSNYLMGKYSCLKSGNNVAVSVTSGLLRKAMSDEKTGQWLERELSKAPDYIKEAQQSAFSLAWKSPWTEEPGGYSPWDRKVLDMTELLTLSLSRH